MPFNRLFSQGSLTTEDDTPTPGEGASASDIETVQAQADDAEVQAQIVETEAELAQAEDQADQTADVAMAVEELRIMAVSAHENGGITPELARSMRMSVEQMTLRLRGQPSQFTRTMPDMQCFGGTMSKRDAGSLQLESIADFAKSVWEGLKKMLKNIREKIKEVFYKYFGRAEAIVKRAKKVAELSSNTSDKTKADADKKIEDESLAGHLCVKNKGDGPSITGGVRTLADVCKKAAAANDVVNKSCDKATDALEAAEDLSAEKLTAAATAITGMSDAIANEFKSVSEEDSAFPGNKSFKKAEQTTDPAKTVAGARFVSGSKITVKALDVAKGEDIRSIASAAEDIANSFIDARKSIEDSDKNYQKLEKAIDRLAKADGDDSSSSSGSALTPEEAKELDRIKEKIAKNQTPTKQELETKSRLEAKAGKSGGGSAAKKEAVAAVRAVMAGINAPAKNILTYGLQTAGYAVTYCEKSVVQYEK
jgi:hypothetical protein